MDAVYILGKGSLCDNKEIRYSLRTLEQNMLDLERVFVVGERPEFLRDVEHIEAADETAEAWRNVYLKIRRACESWKLTENFLLMNDDFFLTEPFMGQDWPYYALRGANGGTDGVHSFHVHAPLRINKHMFLKMPLDPAAPGRHSFRSFYCNFYGVKPTFCDDFVLTPDGSGGDYDEQIKKYPCFSVSDQTMLHPGFAKWLDKYCFLPSRFEAMNL